MASVTGRTGLPPIEMTAVGKSRFGMGSQEFGLGCVEVKLSVSYSQKDTEQVIGYMSVEFSEKVRLE